MTVQKLTGKINEPITMTVANPADWFQTNDITMDKNLGIALDQKSAYFTPSEDGIYAFECGTEQFIVTVGKGLPPVPDTNPEIPPVVVEPIPDTGTIVDFSIFLNNGIERHLTKHGEFDKYETRLESRAGSNRDIFLDGKGKIIISGDQVRGYFHFITDQCPYNCKLEYDRTFEGKADTEDDGSDELVSRHNEGEIAEEAYNKIGGEITSEELGGKGNCKRETTHPNYVPIKKYSGPKVKNGQKHHVTYQLIHDDTKKEIHLKKWIDNQLILEAVDDSAPDTFFDKKTLKRKSYFRIRNNGAGKTIVENPKITILPD